MFQIVFDDGSGGLPGPKIVCKIYVHIPTLVYSGWIHSLGFLSLKSNEKQKYSFLPRNDSEISEEQELNGLSFVTASPLKSYNLYERFTSKLDRHHTLLCKHL